MKVILIVMVLFTIYKSIDCFACGLNFCDSVKCQSDIVCDEKKEFYVKKGSTCGCCDVCYRKLFDGERCVPRFHGGGAFLAKCIDDFECGTEGKCVQKNTP